MSTTLDGCEAPHELELAFGTGDELGRIIALIGRNGTGKTQLLSRLALATSGLRPDGVRLDPWPQMGLILAVSFSVFDRFTRPIEDAMSYRYVGLRDPEGGLDPAWADRELKRKRRTLLERGRGPEWERCLVEAGLPHDAPWIAEMLDENGRASVWLPKLRALSSGHQLLVTLITHLFAELRDGSLVLFDEPETHLHPTMLAALMRALHVMLDRYKSFAVVATHSPIVLQEIPSRYVRVLDGDRARPRVRSYPGESFAENLDVIVDRVFGSSEEDRNYRRRLDELLTRRPPAEVKKIFQDPLNLEIRVQIHDAEEAARRPR